VLAELGVRLFTIELVPALAERAARTLRELGYANVQVRIGDGSLGWPEEAPFDAIIVTAAAPAVPPALLEQLAVGGRLILPVGEGEQMLVLYRRTPQGYQRAELLPVAFVPLRGRSAGGAPAP
jgi:protein-L-isoaspartate(D-aspartate) O-methyltransferase